VNVGLITPRTPARRFSSLLDVPLPLVNRTLTLIQGFATVALQIMV